ncbi:MAG: hypothetical protein ACI8R9_001478 [Paraglaciecola sp.]
MLLVIYTFATATVAKGQQNWQLELNDAQAFVAAGDKLHAFAQYQRLAKQENGLAQFTLAWFIKTGWLEGQQDPVTACSWFLRSAQHMIPIGLQETGHCYRDELLPSKKPAQTAIHYYVEAQKNGVFAAACDALVVEIRMLKLQKPTQLAACEQAAAQNALLAQEILVDLYADKNALNNNNQALYWLQQAAPKSAKSAYQFALTLQASDAIPTEDVRYWFEASASLGFEPAYLDTATLYYQGISDDMPMDIASVYQAKAYMWSKAWLESKDAQQQVPTLVNQIIATTPQSWQLELSEKVKKHLAQFPR